MNKNLKSIYVRIAIDYIVDGEITVAFELCERKRGKNGFLKRLTKKVSNDFNFRAISLIIYDKPKMGNTLMLSHEELLEKTKKLITMYDYIISNRHYLDFPFPIVSVCRELRSEYYPIVENVGNNYKDLGQIGVLTLSNSCLYSP